jgi:hypothetical protein
MSKEGAKGGKAEINRGTQDELEIMVQILEKNLALRQQVLEKIRQTKYRLGSKKPEQSADADKPKAK